MHWLRWLMFWKHESLGARGERLAASHVRGRGMRVLARNVRCGRGELDIVALDGDVLVFVEVRTRTREDFMTPEQSIRRKKRQSLRQAARWFLRARRLSGMPVRFDTLAVVGEKGREEIRYHKAAFGWGEKV